MNLEGRNNRPATNLFYRGEMNARLQDAPRWRLDWWVLGAYKAVAGFGLSVWRPLAWFLTVATLGTAAFAVEGLNLEPDSNQPDHPASLTGTFTFSVRSMLSFFSPPEASLSTADLWTQIGLRLVGPALLALSIFAVRERVAR